MLELTLPLVCCLLMPLALVGLTLINTGLNRTRSAAHSALSGMCAAAVAVIAFVIVGCAIAGIAAPTVENPWAFRGSGQLFGRGIHAGDPRACLLFLFQLLAAALAVQAPTASGAERWRLRAICASSAVLSGVIFPLLSFWFWGGGYLARLGAIDAGGAGVVQVSGGLSALAIAWILGPRQGKFSHDGVPLAMPGHNAVIVVVGSLLALIGWMGLNAGGSLLFYRVTPGAAFFAMINTVVAASGGVLAALVTTALRFGKPDASITANGWVCGLIAVSAGAPFFKLSEALLVGLAAGVLVVFAIEVVEMRMRVDDPAGAISVHAAGGIWGLFAAGLFTGYGTGNFAAQLLAVGTVVGFVLPSVYGLNLVMNRFLPQRVESMGERQGLDLHELGAGAYPEFVTHREDFPRR